MLRWLVALLLLANLGFLALSRGWLAPGFGLGLADQREPQRLQAQIDPNSIQVLPPAAADAAQQAAAATAAAAATPACLQAGPFNAEQVAAAEAAVERALPGEAKPTRVPQAAASHWLLVMPRADDADADSQEQERLRAEGYAVAPAGPGRLALGRYERRSAADAALDAARARGVRSPSVVEQPAAPRYLLQVEAADAALRARLQALTLAPSGTDFVPCGAR